MRLVQVFCLILSLVVAASAVPNFIQRKDEAKRKAIIVDRAIIDTLDTNAKRLAAGLPPLPARRLWSRTETAKRWSTSPVPYKGKLGVKAANGTFVGFVSKILSYYGTYILDLNEPNAACISFSAPKFDKSSGLLFKDTTSNSTKAPFLGAVIQHGFSLAPAKGWKRAGSASSVPVVGTAQTAPDQPPQQIANTYQGQNSSSNGAGTGQNGNPPSNPTGADGESSIWDFDPKSQQVSASWTNPDRSSVKTTPYYNPDSPPGVALVSDVPAYTAENPDAFPIILNFVV